MKFVIILLFLSVCGYFIFYTFKSQVACVFTEKYSQLRKIYPTPLYTWRHLSISLKTEGFADFNIRGYVKGEVYSDQLILSVMGQGLCLPFDRLKFQQGRILFQNYLLIENLPVKQKTESLVVDNVFKFGRETSIRVFLPMKKINLILQLQSKKNGSNQLAR